MLAAQRQGSAACDAVDKNNDAIMMGMRRINFLLSLLCYFNNAVL
jgi:hypothetical protein